LFIIGGVIVRDVASTVVDRVGSNKKKDLREGTIATTVEATSLTITPSMINKKDSP
jgi:hypothetical protein